MQGERLVNYMEVLKMDELIKISKDVNGSLQILRKVFPNAFSYGIEGYSLNPVIINVV